MEAIQRIPKSLKIKNQKNRKHVDLYRVLKLKIQKPNQNRALVFFINKHLQIFLKTKIEIKNKVNNQMKIIFYYNNYQ